MKKPKNKDVLQRCEKIINSVVRSFAKKNRMGSLTQEDLTNEGWIATLQTIKKYESFNDGLLYIRIRGHILDVVRRNLTLLTGPQRADKQLTHQLIQANQNREDCYEPWKESTQRALIIHPQHEQDLEHEELKGDIRKILGNERADIFFDRVMHGYTLMELGQRYNYSHSNIACILQRCWKEIKESSLVRSRERH